MNLGPSFYERNWDGGMQTQFFTRPLWGVGSTGPYGHDGRSTTLSDVICAMVKAHLARDKHAGLLKSGEKIALPTFLNALVVFPPDHTVSTLDLGDPTKAGFPQIGHDNTKQTVLFGDPSDSE